MPAGTVGLLSADASAQLGALWPSPPHYAAFPQVWPGNLILNIFPHNLTSTPGLSLITKGLIQ